MGNSVEKYRYSFVIGGNDTRRVRFWVTGQKRLGNTTLLFSVGRAPTWATEPSVQLDLESMGLSSDGPQTCHTAVSDSR